MSYIFSDLLYHNLTISLTSTKNVGNGHAQHARITFEISFFVRNDGAGCIENNFNVVWNEDNVKVIVSGKKQSDVEYILNFDGTIE